MGEYKFKLSFPANSSSIFRFNKPNVKPLPIIFLLRDVNFYFRLSKKKLMKSFTRIAKDRADCKVNER